jgi:hypothetical protein
MERRGFLLGLAGALAAVAIGPTAVEAATPKPAAGSTPAPQPVTPEVAGALDSADKAESQYYYVRRRRYRPRRVVYYRPVRRRVVYYRPVRRYRPVYYSRPVRRYRPIVVF